MPCVQTCACVARVLAESGDDDEDGSEGEDDEGDDEEDDGEEEGDDGDDDEVVEDAADPVVKDNRRLQGEVARHKCVWHMPYMP